MKKTVFMRQMSCSGEGVQDVVDYLCEYSDKLSLEEVKENQKKRLKDWA
ncbi:MAG: hypothetical protein IKF07_02485 [Eubacterium sp.]|nr:hypothetical protein [Eubacterium sp.]